MTKCIIHIGMHKTGTTSIQNSLENFHNENFYYARLDSHPNHSVPIYGIFSNNPQSHHLIEKRAGGPARVADYLAKIRQELSASISNAMNRTLIISGEDIARLELDEVERLKTYLSSYFDELKVIAYIRKPMSYISSAFQQTVRSGRRKTIQERGLYRSYRSSFQKFDQVFGQDNVELRLFEKGSLVGGNVVNDFCSLIGLDLPSIRIIRSNESTSMAAVCLLFQYNRYCSEKGVEPITGGKIELLSEFLEKMGAAPFQFSRSFLQNIIEQNVDDIRWVEQRLGASLDEPEYPSFGVMSEQDLLCPISGARRAICAALTSAGVEASESEAASDVELFHRLRTSIFGEPEKVPHQRLPKPAVGDNPRDARRIERRRDRLIKDKWRSSGGPEIVKQGRGQFGSGPEPLLNIDKRLMVIWSPKSACTTIYYWFSTVSGFGDELKEFGNKIHQHRIQRYYLSDLHARSKNVPLQNYNRLRVIREPYSRAVSIYRHTLKTRLFSGVEAAMGMAPGSGYSFQEFLDFLASIDIWSANPHLKPQVNRLELENRPTHVINISKGVLFSALNAFEEEVGLHVTDFSRFEWLHSHESKRKAPQTAASGAGNESTRLTHDEVKAGQFPGYSQLLTPATRAKIEIVYAADFEAYKTYL